MAARFARPGAELNSQLPVHTCMMEATISSSQLHRPQQLRLHLTQRGQLNLVKTSTTLGPRSVRPCNELLADHLRRCSAMHAVRSGPALLRPGRPHSCYPWSSSHHGARARRVDRACKQLRLFVIAQLRRVALATHTRRMYFLTCALSLHSQLCTFEIASS